MDSQEIPTYLHRFIFLPVILKSWLDKKAMKLMKLFQTLVIALTIIGNFTLSYAQGLVPPDKVFISPDKMHSFQIEDYDREYHFKVKDLSSGKIASFEDEYAPVFAVKWTADSKSIFIAAHYARGKLLDVIHNEGENWTLKEVTPSEDREYESEILNWKFEGENVRLSFKVMIYSRTSPEFYKCNFDFNPSTGLRSNYKKSLISGDTYGETKSALAPD